MGTSIPKRRRSSLVLYAAAAAVFVLAGLLWWPLAVSHERNLTNSEKAVLLNRLNDIGGMLSSVVNRRLVHLNGLAALVHSQNFRSEIEDEFFLFAAGIADNDPSIRALQIYRPRGTLLVYPLKGNEVIAGRTLVDLLTDDRANVREDVNRAMESRKTTLSDPYELRQGGFGLVARSPIFKNDSFWGLAIVVLDLDSLLTYSGIGNTSFVPTLAIKDNSGSLFYGDPAAFSGNAVTCAVPLPEGAWTLGATLPADTRNEIRSEVLLFRLLGLALAAGLAFAAYLFLLRMRALANQVDSDAKRLQEKEQEYRNLFEQAGEGIFVFDSDGNCVNVNPSACFLLGRDRAGILSLTAGDMFDPWEGFKALFAGSGAPAAAVRTYRTKRPDGIRLDAEVVWRRSPDGAYQGTARDVTERRLSEQLASRAEEETQRLLELAERSRRALLSVAEDQKLVEAKLRRSEELLRETGRIAKVGGFEFDPASGVGTWTEEVALIYDVDPSATTDKAFGLSFYSPESRKRIEEAIGRAAENLEPYDLELEMTSAKGKRKWVRTIGRPVVTGGRVESIRGSFQDITDMKLAVEARRSSEEQFKQLFDTISDSVFIHAPDGAFILANRGTLDNLGCGTEALRVQDVEAPEFTESFPQRVADLMSRGSLVFETVHIDKLGKRIPVEVQSKLIDFQGGKAILNVARDIGERKRVEERIMQTLGERETLLREVFHRTRNNMQVILALLAFEEESSQDQRVSEVVKKTSERIMSMALVHQKLYQSQDLSRIDLKEYSRELLGTLMGNRPELEGRVGLDTTLEEISMLIDAAVPFGLVLHELFSNALRHAFPDGRSGTISVRISKDERGSVSLEVADDGVGLPRDFTERCSKTVGINLVRGLIEHQLNGTVEIDTSKGLSCRVRFNDAQYMKRV